MLPPSYATKAVHALFREQILEIEGLTSPLPAPWLPKATFI